VNHAQLVERAVRWLRNTWRCPVVLSELHTAAGEIPDAIGWLHNGMVSILVECKASQADYRCELKKPHRRVESFGGWPAAGHERWFLTPPGLVSADDVLDGWGLAEVRGRQVRRVVTPTHSLMVPFTKREHKEVDWRRLRNEVAMLVSALRRHQAGQR